MDENGQEKGEEQPVEGKLSEEDQRSVNLMIIFGTILGLIILLPAGAVMCIAS